MRFLEFGPTDGARVMLVHGAQVPWQIWLPQIERFQPTFRVIVPVLSGHDLQDPSDFTTVEAVAADIERACVERFGTELTLLCGQSLGGAVASEIWARGIVSMDALVMEGAPLVGQPRILSSLITRSYLSLTRSVKRRDPAVLRRAEGSFLPKRCMPAFLEMIDAMSEETVRNLVRSAGEHRLPDSFEGRVGRVVYVHGTSANELLSKKSAAFLRRTRPEAEIVRVPGAGHCEWSLFKPDEHIRLLESIIDGREGL